MAHFSDLPVELLTLIFSFLPSKLEQQLVLSRTCRTWEAVLLAHQFSKQRYGTTNKHVHQLLLAEHPSKLRLLFRGGEITSFVLCSNDRSIGSWELDITHSKILDDPAFRKPFDRLPGDNPDKCKDFELNHRRKWGKTNIVAAVQYWFLARILNHGSFFPISDKAIRNVTVREFLCATAKGIQPKMQQSGVDMNQDYFMRVTYDHPMTIDYPYVSIDVSIKEVKPPSKHRILWEDFSRFDFNIETEHQNVLEDIFSTEEITVLV